MNQKTSAAAPAESPSPAPQTTAAPAESPEVKEAREAQARRKRADALEEAAKIIGIDVKNSCDQVASFCIVDNEAHVRKAYELLVERLARAHALLKGQIENLPTVNL